MAKERGLICCGESVRGYLAGRNTQTRRLRGLEYINQEPNRWNLAKRPASYENNEFAFLDMADPIGTYPTYVKCPYGVVGDLLWVRETFQPLLAAGIEISDFEKYDYKTGRGYDVNYVATGGIKEWIDGDDNISDNCSPSIHMPKWATRIWRGIANIKVEQMQGEYYLYGDEVLESGIITARKIIDPWVWVIESKKIERQ